MDRYDPQQPGHFAASLTITYTGANQVNDWRILLATHDYMAAVEAYESEQPARYCSGMFFGFRNKDGTVSVHCMRANDLCIVIGKDHCLCSALMSLPAAVEAAIREMNEGADFAEKEATHRANVL